MIVEYISSMDVDTALFKLSVLAAPAGMNEIDLRNLERLNVVNNGRTRPKWTLESAEEHLYLKGERLSDESGINKFMLMCVQREPILYVIFDALRRDKELMRMSAHSLLINDDVYRITVESREVRNGWFNGTYRLSSKEIEALRKAERVGVTIQFAYGAPVFLGFQEMPVADGRQKLLGFLNQCK